MKLSNRAETALRILHAGGYFSYALETNSYTHRTQFTWRLRNHRGSKVKGFGGATFRELDKAGLMGHSRASGFTGSSTHYYLKPVEPSVAELSHQYVYGYDS